MWVFFVVYFVLGVRYIDMSRRRRNTPIVKISLGFGLAMMQSIVRGYTCVSCFKIGGANARAIC